MNAATAEVNAAHKAYLQCVDKQMTDYLKNPSLRAGGTVTEFCGTERQSYLATMKANFPHQYENLVRVDANTY